MRRLFPLLVFIALALQITACSQKGNEAEKTQQPGRSSSSFTLIGLDGKKTGFDEFKGKVVLLEFFATWCYPCEVAAPDIQHIYNKYKDKGFTVVAVSEDEGPGAAAAVKKYVQDLGISYPVFMDDAKGGAAKHYGIFGLPTSFIIDREGRVAAKHSGLSPDMLNEMSREIETLLKKPQ
ncbi:MAG: TlpA family protein disulfide reductase [Nitrospirae bacterium]|nr:MAG: TlpA family protein disulfide reductase [Nitrospirota bacterium]